MNKSMSTILSSVSAILISLFGGVFSIIVTRLIILNYGSDYNGLNATATQFINLLLVMEGGFTTAINVALFEPLANKNYDLVNGILSASSKIFWRIGIIFFLVGTISSAIYAYYVKSEINFVIIFLIFFMLIVSTTFNLAFSTKYRIILQSDNNEYILNMIQLVTLVLTQLTVIYLISRDVDILGIRFIIMGGALISSFITIKLTKNKYTNINFKEAPLFNEIKGTNDIFIQRINGILYSAMPLLFISISAGTLFASVYAVYNNVFQLIKQFIFALINGPRISLGKLIFEREKEYVLEVFLLYEFVVIIVLHVLLVTTIVLIMNFIGIYTGGNADINYQNWTIAILLMGSTFFEIIHIPSGNIINMAGEFKIGRNIQLIASVILIGTMIIGNILWGFYGVLFGILVTSCSLAIMEITYVHNVFFRKQLSIFFKILIPNLFLSIILVVIELKIISEALSIYGFILAGIILVLVNGILILLINYIFNRKLFEQITNRFFGLFRK